MRRERRADNGDCVCTYRALLLPAKAGSLSSTGESLVRANKKPIKASSLKGPLLSTSKTGVTGCRDNDERTTKSSEGALERVVRVRDGGLDYIGYHSERRAPQTLSPAGEIDQRAVSAHIWERYMGGENVGRRGMTSAVSALYGRIVGRSARQMAEEERK